METLPQESPDYHHSTWDRVSTLPIRNGNERSSTTCHLSGAILRVSTLPIRNGNFAQTVVLIIAILCVPYLQGIQPNRYFYISVGFYLTFKQKNSSTISDTTAFLYCLYFIFFSDTVYLFIYFSNVYSKSFLTFIFYILTFQIIYIIFRRVVSSTLPIIQASSNF